MTFDEARRKLAKGIPVRRACWITRLLPAPVNSRPQWDLTPELARECSGGGDNADRSYEPHPTDIEALDWQEGR